MTKYHNKFGVVIVGDELLSGKRRDGHFNFMLDTLSQRGGQLAWVRMVADDVALQAQTYRETLDSGLVVFSFGGIGATPDDLTRQAVAQAFNRELIAHPDGIKLLRTRFADDLNDRRRQLVHFPRGARLIPNPVNQVPGFSLFNHYFVPGFPNMAHPMVEWVLDTQYVDSFDRPADVEYLVHTHGVYESDLIPMIEAVLKKYSGLKVACLPKSGAPGQVELGVKGTQVLAQAGFHLLCTQLQAANIKHTPGLNPDVKI